MLQENYIYATTYTACVIENKIWFVLKSLNVICVFDMEMEKIVKVINIPYKFIPSVKFYAGLINYEHYLYLIPAVSDYILSYNMLNGKFENISCREYKTPEWEEKFTGAFMVEDRIWCVPGSYSQVLVLEAKNGKVARSIDWKDEYRKRYEENTKLMINWVTYNEKNEVIYGAISNTDKILAVDCKSGTLDFIDLKIDEIGLYPTVSYIGGNLIYFSCVSGDKLHCYNLEKKKITSSTFIEERIVYIKSFYDRFIVIESNDGINYYFYDKNLNKIKTIKKESRTAGRWFSFKNDELLRFDGSLGKLEVIKGMLFYKEFDLRIDKKKIKEIYKYIKYPIYENKILTLTEFLSFLK